MGERESVRPEEKSVYCANYKVKEFFFTYCQLSLGHCLHVDFL